MDGGSVGCEWVVFVCLGFFFGLITSSSSSSSTSASSSPSLSLPSSSSSSLAAAAAARGLRRVCFFAIGLLLPRLRLLLTADGCALGLDLGLAGLCGVSVVVIGLNACFRALRGRKLRVEVEVEAAAKCSLCLSSSAALSLSSASKADSSERI